MAYLLKDFREALAAQVSSRPAAAAAYKAGDPRVLAGVDAMAVFFSMLSQQIDLAEVEPFIRARDGTVLADAALKGVLPLARPARATLAVENTGTAAVVLSAGRELDDPMGRTWRVEGSAVIAAGATGSITAVQSTFRTVTHQVINSVPFYEMEITASSDGLHLVGLDVVDDSGQSYAYTPEFANVLAGDAVYHVETDEARRVLVRFGASDAAGAVVGIQPANGVVFSTTVTECAGYIDDLSVGNEFALHTSSPDEAVTLTLQSFSTQGADPPSIDVLRTLARYPALHDESAVFLGDFDHLVRKKISPLFLSVWNEQQEESVRGASINNTNRLFVAAVVDGQAAAVTREQISRIITRADDSYRVTFVDVVEVAAPITVTATVSVVHDPDDVAAKIRTALVGAYGRGTSAAAVGTRKLFRGQALVKVLTDSIPALQDQVADVAVTTGSSGPQLPEQWRYLTADSITVVVERATADAAGLWSA